MTDTDNTAQPEPLDLDATTIETLPEVVAAMLARSYKDKGVKAPSEPTPTTQSA
jgi:hypothetical protein